MWGLLESPFGCKVLDLLRVDVVMFVGVWRYVEVVLNYVAFPGVVERCFVVLAGIL